MAAISLSVDVFAEVLSEDADWYTLGVFLGVPSPELKDIARNYRLEGTMRCLIEVHERYTERSEEPLTWETVITALRRKKNHHLANKIHSKFIKPAPGVEGEGVGQESHSIEDRLSTASGTRSADQVPTPAHHELEMTSVQYKSFSGISNEFETLLNKFEALVSKIKKSLRNKSNVDLSDIQDLVRRCCGLPSLPEGEATFDAVFNRIEEHCSIINFRVLTSIVENLLEGDRALRKKLVRLKKGVDIFSTSANMEELVTLINRNHQQSVVNGSASAVSMAHEMLPVKLKVREFWDDFTVKQFEAIINEIFHTLYSFMSHVSVSKGCICFSWTIPEAVDFAMLLPAPLSLELVELLGIISLHIGSNVIYNIEGEACESIEAAMIQAIELKNIRAVELLLAVGCNPEVATYNGDNAVTNIVNIKQSLDVTSSSSSTVPQYVCVLGHNEHVEAIIVPGSVLPSSADTEQCDSCRIKDKILKQAYQEMDYYRQTSLEAKKGDDNQLSKTEDKAPADPQLRQDQLVAILKKEKQILLRELAAAKDEVKMIKARSSSATKESSEHFEEPKLDEDTEWKQKTEGVEDDELAEILASTESEKIPFVEVVTESTMKQMWLVDESEISFTNEELGCGVFFETNGAVFCGARVAGKEPFDANEHNYKNRYIRSICLSSVIHHPNIVQFIGAAHYSSPRPVLLYELMHCSLFKSLLSIPGDSVAAYSQALDVGHDIGSALYYLHSFKPHPIIHRNVSYTSILLSNPLNDEKRTYKLSGLESANFPHYAVKDGYVVKEVCISPEVIHPNNLQSPARDVFSLGIVLIVSIILPGTNTNISLMPSSRLMNDFQFEDDLLLNKKGVLLKIAWEPMRSFLQQCTYRDHSKRPTISEVLKHVDTLKTKFKSSNIK